MRDTLLHSRLHASGAQRNESTDDAPGPIFPTQTLACLHATTRVEHECTFYSHRPTTTLHAHKRPTPGAKMPPNSGDPDVQPSADSDSHSPPSKVPRSLSLGDTKPTHVQSEALTSQTE
eukprot:6475337-Amphidinium_carterae.2